MQYCKKPRLKEDIIENSDLIKLSAYDLLVRLDIHSFPVNPWKLLDTDPSVYYNSVQNLATYVNISVDDIISPNSAGLIYHASSGKDYIFINDNCSFSQRLWNVTLAIGALELNIVPQDTYIDIPQDYQPVLDFAYYFLLPAVVLKSCSFDSQDKIFRYCGVPFRKSVKKAVKMKFCLESRKQTGIEKIILTNFGNFINQNRIIEKGA